MANRVDERHDERPWLGLGSVQIIPSAPNPQEVYLLVAIINSGKSPAFDVSVTIAEWNSNLNEMAFPIKKCKDDCRMEHAEILPGAFVDIRIPKINQIPLPSIG